MRRRRGKYIRRNFALQLDPQVPEHPGISERAVSRAAMQTMAFDHRIQIVTHVLGYKRRDNLTVHNASAE